MSEARAPLPPAAPDRSSMLMEAYRRGILPSEQKGMVEEAMRRGILKGPEHKAEDPGIASSLWQGFLRGAGATIHGAAQLGHDYGLFNRPIGAEQKAFYERSGEALKKEEETSEKTFQASPQMQQHPWASLIGRAGGEAAASAPLMLVPGLRPAQIAARALPGRLASSAALGAGAGAMQPGSLPQRAEGAIVGGVGGAVGGALGEAVGSTLGRAIANGNERVVEDLFRKAVKPGRGGINSSPQLAAQDRKILMSVDDIIAQKPNLSLTDAWGNQVQGQLPRSIRQFSEAIDQTKKTLFRQYDQMSSQAGQAGARVNLAPTVAAIRQASARPEVAHLHPNVQTELLRLADTFQRVGSYSTEEAQDVIQNLNRTIASFYNNPTSEIVAGASALGNITPTLRASLDQAIETFQGPGYQALRNRYGALRSIEKDVAHAFQREAGKTSGGLGTLFSDLAVSEEAIRGVLTLNPAALARAGGIKAAQSLVRRIHSPNRAIERMFSKRAASAAPSPRGAASGALTGAATFDQAQRAYNANRRGDLTEMRDLARKRATASQP